MNPYQCFTLAPQLSDNRFVMQRDDRSAFERTPFYLFDGSEQRHVSAFTKCGLTVRKEDIMCEFSSTLRKLIAKQDPKEREKKREDVIPRMVYSERNESTFESPQSISEAGAFPIMVCRQKSTK